MSIRAKFMVTEIREHVYNPNARTLVLSPQYDTSIPEDRRFCEATPNGRFEMYVTNPVVIEQMKNGRQFYIDFTPVE